MANIVYIATSLDGFIAGPNGEMEWLMDFPNPGNSDYDFADFISGIDALVMGRSTFDLVASFEGDWPYPIPVFVLSTTLKNIPERLEGKVELINAAPAQIIETLQARGLNRLYIDGGRTIQSFMQESLIDELILSRVPVVLGRGIPLFGKLEAPQNFELVKTEAFENGITKTQYRRMPS